MIYQEKTIETIPVGPLGLIPLKSCTELGAKAVSFLTERQSSLNCNPAQSCSFKKREFVRNSHCKTHVNGV